MLALFNKEIQAFFSSTVGYLVIGLFLLLNGFFLWVFDGSYNILNYGYADLSPFFQLAPWIFLLLIPAITMRTFSEEIKQGTLELLLTKPIPLLHIVLAKFLGGFGLLLIALTPTLLYIWAIDQLGNPVGNYDGGVLLGSYLGLLFLAATYTAIGTFCSSLTENQIVAFIVAVFLCFSFYYGLDALGSALNTSTFRSLSIRAHYDSISRGVLDTRDVIYFISLIALFIFLTQSRLKARK